MDQQTTQRIKAEWDREFARFTNRRHPEDFPALPEMSAGRYTDRRFYDAENKHLWPRVWMLAGHVDDVPEVGSYVLWRDSGAPIIIIRGRDGQIRAFYNTCQHRGGPLVADKCGKTNTLICQYHSWSYDLTGCLKGMPDAHEFPGLDKSKRNLVSVRCELWGNLIFVNRDPEAEPLLDSLGPLVREFSDFNLDKIKIFARLSYDVHANWKAAIDTFQEVYHIKKVHPRTIDAYLDYRSAVFTLYRGGHSRLVLPMKTGEAAAAAQVLDSGRAGADPAHEITRTGNSSYTIFPNIVTPTAEFQFPFMVFWPTGPNTTRMDVIYLAPQNHADPQSAECQGVIAAFGAVMQEDLGIMNAMRESMETVAFRSVRLAYTERRIYQHHEEVDRIIGAENVPADLAIPQILQDHVEDW